MSAILPTLGYSIYHSLVALNDKGEIYSVRYEAVNAMLLNEFLKEHHEVHELQARAHAHETDAREQAAIIARQQKQLEALNAALQKVNERLDLSNPASQLTASQN